MKINLKWIIKQLPIKLLIALLVTVIWGSFQGVINGAIFGKFPTLVHASQPELNRFLIYATILFVLVYTGFFLEHIIINYTRRRLKIALKKQMMNISFQHQEKVSKGLNRISNDANKIDDSYFQNIINVFVSGTEALISTVYVLNVNLVMGLIAILFSALSMIPALFGKQRLAALGKKWSKSNNKTLEVAEDWLSGRAEIIQYNAKKIFFKKLVSKITNTESLALKQENLNWVILYCNLLATVASFIIPWGIGFIFIQNQMFNVTISVLLTLTLTANNVVQSTRNLMQYWTEMLGSKDIRKLPEKLKEAELVQNSDPKPNLDIKNLGLKYSNYDIFKNINLHIPYGQKILLTGESGVGKSSLLNIIANNIHPSEGQVTYDDRQITPTDVIYIRQDPWLFSGSVRENLTLGKDISDDKLLAALKQVNLLTELGDNILDREISAQVDTLSGGQKQRLSIARALLHQRPIILMDEITSSIDDKNADIIRDLIYNLPNTIIEVAHHTNKQLLKKYNFEVLLLRNKQLTKER
ncbi:ATP-binding cassette subfamily B protein [Lactobacillus colini]|uniref:ATP-binding cassette subfamily B protein n=1 Tax=Lactobacillus colini TaxID=1819254 RepID=A0ABS4MGI8_9LACO|nr:ABC transporter ATP-binding protein [Lactobacillus colini]MBP2058812.1 ATP-binding cassette subfamily B protein [Lactobacillus colini]